ncbi:MAG: phage baseplate assembly protein V [Rhizobiaceae bacterium]|nr:phage baseplate assembly protein V [Rhizobiaceae bacterium]MCC0000967.1 phage baseplate assembly protein V [Methylobacteriaceae bacterium]
MRQIMQIERRMQDIERKLENKQRQGKVTEVKFDQDKKRWYAKMEEGSGDETLKTDWMPWKSFSHGAIKFSVPPRVGQRVTLNSPNGELEQGVLEPFHYGPDDPSPHDKQDEIFVRVEKPGAKDQEKVDKTLDIIATCDNLKVSIGKSSKEITKDQVTTKTETETTTAEKRTKREVGDQKHTIDASGVRATNQAGNMVLKNDGNVFLNC